MDILANKFFHGAKTYEVCLEILRLANRAQEDPSWSLDDFQREFAPFLSEPIISKAQGVAVVERYITTHCGKLYLVPELSRAGLTIPKELYTQIFRATQRVVDYPVVKFFLLFQNLEPQTPDTYVFGERSHRTAATTLIFAELAKYGYRHCDVPEFGETLLQLATGASGYVDVQRVTVPQLAGFTELHQHWRNILYAVDYITQHIPESHHLRPISDTDYLRSALRNADYRPYRELIWALYGPETPQTISGMRRWLQTLHPGRDFSKMSAPRIRTLAKIQRFELLRPQLAKTIPEYQIREDQPATRTAVTSLSRAEGLTLYMWSFVFPVDQRIPTSW